MRRSLLAIAIVATISGWISWGERAAGRPNGSEWVRTADGWQSRRVLAAREAFTPPPVHPAIVAGLQLGMSLYFLLAMPPRVQPAVLIAKVQPERRVNRRRRSDATPLGVGV